MTVMAAVAGPHQDAVHLAGTHAVLPSGVFTVVGPHGHRSFTIERQEASSDFAPGRRLISLLTGPDNEADWTAFGFVSDEPATRYPISVWRKFRGEAGERSDYEKYADLLVAMITRGQRDFRSHDGHKHKYEILLSRRCIRCDRRLTTPESLEAGVGPECRKLQGGR